MPRTGYELDKGLFDLQGAPEIHLLDGTGDHAAHGQRTGPADAVLAAAVDGVAQSGVVDAAVEKIRADGGHDPEDYQHLVGEEPTDLNLHPNSPGYRLILNNILFPAARKKKQKT